MVLPISDICFVIVREGPSGRSEVYLPPSAAALSILHEKRPGKGFTEATGESVSDLAKGLKKAHGSAILANYSEPRIRDAEFGGIILAGDVRRAGAGGPGVDSFNHVTIRNPYTKKIGDVGTLSQVTVEGERAEQIAKMDESLSEISVLDRHAYALLDYFYGIVHGGTGKPIVRCKDGGKIDAPNGCGEKVNAPVFLPMWLDEKAKWEFVAERYLGNQSLASIDAELIDSFSYGSDAPVNKNGVWTADEGAYAHPFLERAMGESVEIKCLKGGELRYPELAQAFFSFDSSQKDKPSLGKRKGIVYLGTDGDGTPTAGYVYSNEKKGARDRKDMVFVYDASIGAPYFVEITAGGLGWIVETEQGILDDAREKLIGGGLFGASYLRTGQQADFRLVPVTAVKAYAEKMTTRETEMVMNKYGEMGK
jgi:hypothetical protein